MRDLERHIGLMGLNEPNSIFKYTKVKLTELYFSYSLINLSKSNAFVLIIFIISSQVRNLTGITMHTFRCIHHLLCDDLVSNIVMYATYVTRTRVEKNERVIRKVYSFHTSTNLTLRVTIEVTNTQICFFYIVSLFLYGIIVKNIFAIYL